MYIEYFPNLTGRDAPGEETIRGMLRIAAVVPAKEKLRTHVTDTTVDARQRLKAFRTLHNGETVVGFDCWTPSAVSGSRRDETNSMGDNIWWRYGQ